MNIAILLPILKGIISSAPAAIALFEQIAPLLGLKDGITHAEFTAATANSDVAHTQVAAGQKAIADLIASRQ